VINADDLAVGDDETSIESAVKIICDELVREAIIPDYCI